MPKPHRHRAVIAVAAGALVMVVRARTPAPVPIEVMRRHPSHTTAALVIDVEGAVARPGVVRLASGARVADAIAAAGGTTPDADPAALNKAAPLHDGARVYVPRYGESPPAGSVGSRSETKIDINRATVAELESLPGIGEHRRTHRSRARAEGLREGRGAADGGLVSARVLSDIRDL